jgi:histone H1-like protein Hc1
VVSKGPLGGTGAPIRAFPTKLSQDSRTLMTQNFEKLVQAVEAVRPDVEKAVKGNKAATSRVRKAMQEVKAIAQEIRKEMLEMRDSASPQ